MAFPGGGLRLGAVANSRWLASFLKRTVVCDVEDVEDVLLHMIQVWKEAMASRLMGEEV